MQLSDYYFSIVNCFNHHIMNTTFKTLKSQLPDTIGKERIDLILQIIRAALYHPFEETKSLIEEAKEVAKDLGKKEVLMEVFYEEAYFYGEHKAFEETYKILEKILVWAKEKKNDPLLAKVLFKYATCYRGEFNFSKSRTYYYKALAIAEKNDWKNPPQPMIYNNIGLTYWQENLKDKAADYFHKAIIGFKKFGQEPNVALAYHNLALVMRDPLEVIDYLKKAIDINLHFENSLMLCRNYRLIATTYKSIDQSTEAKSYLLKMFAIAEEIKSPNFIMQSCYQMGQLAVVGEDENALKEAKKWCNKLFSLLHKETKMDRITEAYFLRANIYLKEKKYEAIKLSITELQARIATHNLPRRVHYNIAYFLYLAYEGLEDFKNAFIYLKKFMAEEKSKNDLEIQKKTEEINTQYETKEKEAEVKRLQEMEEIKTRFFSQITHELRTPLTLIQGPAQQILAANAYPKIQGPMQIINRNANRLLLLVNQLLDVNKLEAKKMALNNSHGDLPPFVEAIIYAFQTLAKQKQIQLNFSSDVDALIVNFDVDKIEKILYNLLSNAFKFTPTNGQVKVQLLLLDTIEEQTQNIQITVADTGKGISKAALPHIFNRFYQADDSYTREAEGTGIGLSLVKELTALMNGNIEVQSTLGKGTTFTLSLPLEISSKKAIQTTNEKELKLKTVLPALNYQTTTNSNQTSSEKKKTNANAKPTLLLIEDNTDIHQYIKSILEKEYNILAAYNGNKGLAIAQKQIPDIIISDVMMPGKNGYEVCNIIKNDVATSHIPLILLTAKAALSSRLEGLEQGADVYLSKPFSAEELRLQTHNLLKTRNNLQQKYQDYLLGNQSPTNAHTSLNQKETTFLQKAIQIVEAHLSDESFTVNKLAKALHLSNSHLYRKIQALTNTTSTQFIRNIRLAKAKVMLENQVGNVSDIAFEVGMTPNYFTKAFTKQYGYSPRALLTKTNN